MKLGLFAVALAVFLWLGLWATNTGVLVYSADTGVLATRDCRYLVGVSVVKKYAPLAGRCQLLSR